MAHATTANLATLLGRTLTTAEEGKAGVYLDVATFAIDDHLNGRAADATLLQHVATLAARRLLELPDGVRQEVLGDWQASYAPAEYLSADERRLLDSGAGGNTRLARRTASPLIYADVWDNGERPA